MPPPTANHRAPSHHEEPRDEDASAAPPVTPKSELPTMQKNHECKPNPLPMARARAEPTAAVSRCRTTSLHNARPTVGRARNDTCERNAFGDRRGTRPQRASARCVARKRDRTEKLA